jgi:hypothetical protein
MLVQVPHSQFLMQRPNFPAQHPNFQMQRPQQQPTRPNGQQPSRQNMQQGPCSNAPTTHGAPPQGNCTGGACFKCSLTGHFAWQCPTRSTTTGAGNQVKPQGQQNFMHDQHGSSASPGCSTGYVFCQFAPCNYFIRFWSISFIHIIMFCGKT